MYLTQAIQRNAKTKANQTAVQFADRSKTWKQVHDRVAKFASALINLGVQEGDRVAMLALNSDRYYEYYYATPWAGAVLVPLNIRWSLQENLYSLKDSGAKILIVDDAFLEMGQSLAAELAQVNTVIYIGEKQTPAGMLNYEEILEAAEVISPQLTPSTEMAGIFYTGGTTGFPKGVMLSHQNLWTSSLAIMADFNLARQGDVVAMHAAPMFHLACGALLWSSTIAGINQVIVPAFEPNLVGQTIEKFKVTDTLLVPTMISMFLASDAIQASDMSSLKQIMYGASPMPEGTLVEAMEKLPQVGFVQAYGQTELAPLCSVLGSEYHVLEGAKAGKLRSAGRPGFCVDVEIRDDNGNALPPGKIGEVVVTGPNTMMGYWNNPEQTAKTLVDGWVMTGDAGYMDEDGFLFLVDRVKDMIVSGGENVFSAEVENAVSKHPAVHEVVVIGIPSEKWGESVHAIVRPKPGHAVSEGDIISFCKDQIAGYKTPRSVEFREEAFPITGAGKIRKGDLREKFWAGKEKRIN